MFFKKYKRKPGPYLLPRLSITHINVQLKQLAKKAGWDYPLPKCRSIGGQLKELKKEGGHAPNSKEFYRYVSIAQDYMDTTVKKAHAALLAQAPQDVK